MSGKLDLATQIQREQPEMFSKGMALGTAVDAKGLLSVIKKEVQKRNDILPEEAWDAGLVAGNRLQY